MNTFRQLSGRLVPPASILLSVGSYAVMTALLLGRARIVSDAADTSGLGEGIFGSVDVALGGAILEMLAMALVAAAVLLTYLFLPGFLTGLLALPAAVTWRRPTRVLVLRRFGTPEATRHLRRVLRSEVAPHGHVYTLADQDILVPWYIRIPVIFTQLVFLHFREPRPRSAKAVERLRVSMRTTWARNVNWVVSRWKTFPVRCPDDQWRQVVSMAADEVDIIIIDVSEPSENLGWEIRKCRDDGSLAKVLFVCRQAAVDEARAFLRDQGVSHVDRPMFILDDDDSATGLGTELERSRAETRPERSAPVTGHLRAVTLMAGPFVWAGVLLAGVAAIDSATTGSSGGVTESLFADVVARAGDPGDRDEALAELSRLIEESTPARPSLEWVGDFEANVMPLYSSLWDDEPRRRSQILSDLQRAASTRGVAIWRDVLSQGAAADPGDIERTIAGILGARARENAPDLVDYLESARFFRAEVLGLLVYLDDTRAVPGLIRLARRENQEWVELRPAIREVLRRILDGDLALHPLEGAAELQGRSVTLILGDPEEARQRLWDEIAAMLNQAAVAERPNSVPLYGDVRARRDTVGFQVGQSSNVLFHSPTEVDLGRTALEHATLFDAAILVVDAVHGLSAVTRAHVELAADLGIPRVVAYVDVRGVTDPDGYAEVLDGVGDLLAESGIDEEHRSVVVDPSISGTDFVSGIIPTLQRVAGWPQRPVADRGGVRFVVAASFALEGSGTAVLGYHEGDDPVVGERLRVVGQGSQAEVVVDARYNGHGLDFADGLIVDLPPGVTLVPGHVLTTINAVRESRSFQARVAFLSVADGGPDGLFSVLPGQGVLQVGRTSRLAFRGGEADISEIRLGVDPPWT